MLETGKRVVTEFLKSVTSTLSRMRKEEAEERCFVVRT